MIHAKDSKMVSSYYCKKHNSGIIELVINAEHKAFGVEQFNNTDYEINNNYSGESVIPNYPLFETVQIPEIEELFDKENYIRYFPCELHNKGQHHFLWIPISLLGHEKLQDKWTETQKN